MSLFLIKKWILNALEKLIKNYFTSCEINLGIIFLKSQPLKGEKACYCTGPI